jgi:hypothetical protein
MGGVGQEPKVVGTCFALLIKYLLLLKDTGIYVVKKYKHN